MADEKPKIIVDEDWKSQVEAEKAAAANAKDESGEPAESAAGGASAAGAAEADPPMPPASFAMLVQSLAAEAMIALGQLPHPATGELTPQRNHAKYLIDTLEMLREKTLGNVPAEESAGVEQLLHQLRMAFVSMPKSPAAASQSAASQE